MKLIAHPDSKVWIAVSVPGEAQERGRFAIAKDGERIFQPGEVIEIAEERLKNAAIFMQVLVAPGEHFTVEPVCP